MNKKTDGQKPLSVLVNKLNCIWLLVDWKIGEVKRNLYKLPMREKGSQQWRKSL